jgi:hypothetical protein
MEPSAAVRAGHTASALPEVTKHILVTNSPIPTRIPIFPCYNNFLNYHKLPLLSLPNPNLFTFLLHIYKNTTKLAFKISVNSQLTETHIYNNLNDPILPLHTIILPLNYHNYYYLPIRSNSQRSSSDSLDFSSDWNNPLNTNNTSNNIHHLDLNIATHNVRGFNSITKREAWQDYCLNYNISISSITETKISNKTNLFFCNSQHYTYYWANSETSAEGTAIMIKNYLKPHVHNCLIHEGGAIALDLFFKNDIKLRIISVYLSSTDIIKRNNTQNTVINWIQQANQLHIQPIILGDFNTQDNTFSSSTKYKLVNFLNHNNFYDIGLHFNNTHHTWSNQTSSSRIDYV